MKSILDDEYNLPMNGLVIGMVIHLSDTTEVCSTTGRVLSKIS